MEAILTETDIITSLPLASNPNWNFVGELLVFGLLHIIFNPTNPFL